MSTPERSTLPLEPKPSPVDPTRYVPDHLVQGFTVIDPALVRTLKAEREATGLDRRDEMWEGVYVVSPIADNEHQQIVGRLTLVVSLITDVFGGDIVQAGANVSDRSQGWHSNYRIPDVVVYLAGNPSRNRGTHWEGGPDLAIEVLSERDLGRKKLDFYAQVNTREVLFIDRDTWTLELYRLAAGKLKSVGTSNLDQPSDLTSEVLPIRLRMVPGEDRPMMEINRLGAEQTWRI